MKCFKLKLLRKWRHSANEAGSDIIRNSYELRHMPFSFWLKTFGATFFSWTARYWVVNAILMAFFVLKDTDWATQFLIFARQLIMWIMMLISPTPGGSGFAEFVFKEYRGFLYYRRRSRCSDRYGHRMASDHLLSLSVRRCFYRTEMDRATFRRTSETIDSFYPIGRFKS